MLNKLLRVLWIVLWGFSIGWVINDINAGADLSVMLHAMNFATWTALMLLELCFYVRDHEDVLMKGNVMFYVCTAFTTVSMIVAFYSFMVGASSATLLINCLTVGIWVALTVISYNRSK